MTSAVLPHHRVCGEETYNGALSHNKAPSSLFRISDIFPFQLKCFFPFNEKVSSKGGKEGARGLKIMKEEFKESCKTALRLHLLPAGFSIKSRG